MRSLPEVVCNAWAFAFLSFLSSSDVIAFLYPIRLDTLLVMNCDVLLGLIGHEEVIVDTFHQAISRK